MRWILVKRPKNWWNRNHPLKKVLKAKPKKIPTQKVSFCHCHITIVQRTGIKIKIIRVSIENVTSYHGESNLTFKGFAWQQNYRTGSLTILMGIWNMEYGWCKWDWFTQWVSEPGTIERLMSNNGFEDLYQQSSMFKKWQIFSAPSIDRWFNHKMHQYQYLTDQ